MAEGDLDKVDRVARAREQMAYLQGLVDTLALDIGRDAAEQAEPSIRRLVHWSNRSDESLRALEGSIMVDVAGGMLIPRNDPNSEARPDYYPWQSLVAARLFGMHAYNIDKDPAADPGTIQDPEQRALFETFTQSMTHLSMDLAHGLRHPQEMVQTILSDYPELAGNVMLLNCNQLISLGKNSRRSPSFMEALGAARDEQGAIVHDIALNREVVAAGDGLVELGFAVVREGGYLLWDEQIYKRIGDKFVHVPHGPVSEQVP